MELAREFGAVVIDLGFAAPEDVRDARREQRKTLRTERRRVFLAEILVARSCISTLQLARALEHARGYRELGDDESPRLGEIAVAKAYASPAQVYDSLIDQRDEVQNGAQRRLLGEVMVEKCRLTPWELEDVLVTAAELAAGSLRSGATPSDAIPVGPGLYGGGEVYARRYRRDAVRTEPAPARAASRTALVRDATARCARTTPDARVGEALDAAIDDDAEAILVFHHEELVGSLCPFDARALDPHVAVGRVMRRIERTLDSQSPLSEAAELLRRGDDPIVPVISGGDVHGAVTPRALRRAGFALGPESGVELGGSD